MSHEIVVPKGVKVDRPACPFYGFTALGGLLVDSEGNGCGVAGGHRPCAMEMAKDKPNWKRCTKYNHEKNAPSLSKLLDEARIFPHELCPPNAKEWDGVSVRGWFNLILRG